MIAAIAPTPGAADSAAITEDPCSVPASPPAPPAGRPAYSLTVNVRADMRVADGALAVAFTAPSNHPTDRLVFRLWPNAQPYASAGARLTVSRVRTAGRAARTSRPNATTLIVLRSVAAGERVRATMRWKLVLPRGPGFRLKGGGRSIRLGSFFPLLAWDGAEWQRDPPAARLLTETWTSPASDFDVRVTKPKALRVLATGSQVAAGHWRAQAVRDYTLAVGRFSVATATAHVPAPVRVTAGVEAATGSRSPRVFVQRAVASLERYSAMYGAYPWPMYTVAAMADLVGLTGGYEYPTLVYQPATSENVAHETGHQWFYSLVGNDQARDPWLDETLATWAEAAVNGAPPFVDAEIPPEAANRLGEPVSYWDRFDDRRLFLGAYLQGYRALGALGPRADVDCALRRYVAGNAYRTAVPGDLLDALQPSFPDARRILEEFGARF